MMRRASITNPIRFVRLAPAWTVVIACLLCGCTGPVLRPQSPEASLALPPTPEVDLVSKYTHPYGLNYVKVEAVTLATGLAGTGSDPPPTPQRAALLDEMSRRGVENPNEILSSPDTSLVLVRGFLRPGLQQGDRFDVEVRVPTGSETTSLRNGWVLPARLTELAVLGEQIRQGHVLGNAEGAILVDPTADGKENPAIATRGRILGGGIALKSRELGLVISHEHQSVRLSQLIGKAVNGRFYTYVDGRKQGVATPKTDEFIEVRLHPRYKDNVGRYMRVIRNLALDESPTALQARLVLLEHQLSDPLTAANAAIRLEAVGNEQAIEILEQAVKSKDPEVQFYAAEALAYLDRTLAVSPLAQVARNEPAFRVNALAALSAMDDVIAYDALRDLTTVDSAETRYGAFRALWAMNEKDSFVRGEQLGGQFGYHVLDVGGAPMVHVTRSFRPEIVMFGKDQHFRLPLVLDAGKNILVNGLGGGQITISKFETGAEPEQRVVSTSVDEVIRTIVDLGGTYPDVVQALQQAASDGALPESRFRVDALPQSGREFDRTLSRPSPDDPGATPSSEENEDMLDVSTPEPNLFTQNR